MTRRQLIKSLIYIPTMVVIGSQLTQGESTDHVDGSIANLSDYPHRANLPYTATESQSYIPMASTLDDSNMTISSISIGIRERQYFENNGPFRMLSRIEQQPITEQAYTEIAEADRRIQRLTGRTDLNILT